MPSLAYNSLLNLMSLYIEPKKAAEVLGRQLTACKLTADTVSNPDIKNNASRFATACGLYVSDAAKREELKSKLAAL